MPEARETTVTLEEEIAALRYAVERFAKEYREDDFSISGPTRQEIAALRSALARLEASRWRPIAEAPPEHEMLLLWGEEGMEFFAGSHTSFEMMTGVTHWQFAPSPPATTSEEE